MKSSSDMRRRKRQSARSGGIDNQGYDDRASNGAQSVDTDTGSAATIERNERDIQGPDDTATMPDRGGKSSQDELASSLASRLNCDDEEEHADDHNQALGPIESGLRNLTLSSQRQRWRPRQEKRKRLRQTSSAYGYDTNNNADNSREADIHRNDEFSLQTFKSPSLDAGEQFGAIDHDSDNATVNASANDEELDNGGERPHGDRSKTGGIVGIKLNRFSASAHGGGGGGSGSSTRSDHYPNSTGYIADESLSSYCVDSDDKSGSTSISLNISTAKPMAALRPRTRSAATVGPKAATTIRGKLVLASGKHNDSASECESCCSCMGRGGVQDQRDLVNDGDPDSLTQLGTNERDQNNNSRISSGGKSHKVCHCDRAKHQNRIGRRTSNLGPHRQQRSAFKAASECSESSDWFSLLPWVSSSLRLFYKQSDRASSSSSTVTPASSYLRRRKPRRPAAVGQHKDQASGSTSDNSLDSIEWQKQGLESVAGEDQEHSTSAGKNDSTMPRGASYGSEARYEPLPGTSSSQRVSIPSNRVRHLRETSRLYGSSGYQRLGNSYYQKRREPSFFQQYASIHDVQNNLRLEKVTS